MDQGAHNTGGGGGVKEIIARVFTVKYAPCTTFLSFFDPPAGNPQRKEMDCTGRRRDRSLLFFSQVWKEGLPAVSFLSGSNTTVKLGGGSYNTLLPAHSRSHSLTTFFFGPMELFTYP